MGHTEESSQIAATKQKATELRAFGCALQKHRKAKALTQEQLSWQTKIDRKFISSLERGVKEPGLQTILKLTRALEIPVAAFMAEVAAFLEEFATEDATLRKAPDPKKNRKR